LYGRGHQSGIGFGPAHTPQIIKQLMIVNAGVWVIGALFPAIGYRLQDLGGAAPADFWSGQLWQPLSYMWLHGGLWHVAINMFVLWMFGSPIAMAWGEQRFLRFYLICGVGAGLIIVTFPWLLVATGAQPRAVLSVPTVGASGAVYGVVLAYSLTWPNRVVQLIFPPVAFRAIWLIPLQFFLEFYGGARNVSHVGHLGGVLVAWLLLRGETQGRVLPTWNQLRYRLHRWRMRRRLRAVRRDERDFRRPDDHDRTLH
jgi:membrane associated rhomboid family serine protease